MQALRSGCARFFTCSFLSTAFNRLKCCVNQFTRDTVTRPRVVQPTFQLTTMIYLEVIPNTDREARCKFTIDVHVRAMLSCLLLESES